MFSRELFKYFFSHDMAITHNIKIVSMAGELPNPVPNKKDEKLNSVISVLTLLPLPYSISRQCFCINFKASLHGKPYSLVITEDWDYHTV